MLSRRINLKSVAGVLMALVLAMSSSLSIAQSAYAANVPDTTAKVSFTFDDGLSSSLLAAQTLQPYGITGTNYVITHCVGLVANASNNDCAADTTKNYMSWQDIVALQNTYGWEIGSHTVTHPLTAKVDNPTLTDAQLDSEMSASKQTLISNGLNVTSFATPYGDYDNRSIAAAAKYYSSHRAFQDLTYSSDVATNTFPYFSPRSSYPYNNYLLSVVPVQGDVSVATVKAYIDQAKANNQWVILVFHEIKADNDASYDATKEAYQYKAGNLAAIAAYVKSLGVQVVNMSAALAGGTNLMPGSSFNNGIADGWTTDSATKILADAQTTSLAGHGSFDGTVSGPLNSISFKGSTAATNLFAPKINVRSDTTYTVKSFINVTSNSGTVDFHIDEYDANGAVIGAGKTITGIKGTSSANDVQAGNVNFLYTPSTSTVAGARLSVVVAGANLTGYLDNIEWLSPNGAAPVTPPPTTPAAGDVNGDAVINALDLSTVLTNWNKTGQTRAQGDVSGDGVVNALDLSAVLSNWSK